MMLCFFVVVCGDLAQPAGNFVARLESMYV